MTNNPFYELAISYASLASTLTPFSNLILIFTSPLLTLYLAHLLCNSTGNYISEYHLTIYYYLSFKYLYVVLFIFILGIYFCNVISPF